MKFCYPHLSTGYVGCAQDEQTLNSRFFAEFESNLDCGLTNLDSDIILFPQRIPRAGFFDELYKIESNDFKVAFKNKRSQLKEHIKLATKTISSTLTESDVRWYINYANLCLRYGLFEAVLETSSFGTPDMPYALEVSLVREAARIDQYLSHSLPVTIDNYLALAEDYLLTELASDRVKIMLLNNIVVTYYRHQDISINKCDILDYAKDLLSLLESYAENTPTSHLYCSVGFRALAMVTEFGHSKQEEFLQKAEAFALLMPADNTLNTVVYLENLYTCTQTMAKWCENNGNLDRAEHHLTKMIEIDKYDSTGYSALGFFYINQKRYSKAAEYFKQALELGPPGAGMNSYYYAKCLEKMGKHDMTIGYLLKATRLDDTAVSPYLDLFEIYKRTNDSMSAYVISQIVKNTPDLWEQLEDNEKKFLQSYAH